MSGIFAINFRQISIVCPVSILRNHMEDLLPNYYNNKKSLQVQEFS